MCTGAACAIARGASLCPCLRTLLLTTSPFPCVSLRVSRTLKAAWAAEGVQAKCDATSQIKKRSARALRATANDYERFQIMVAKKDRSAKRKAK